MSVITLQPTAATTDVAMAHIPSISLTTPNLTRSVVTGTPATIANAAPTPTKTMPMTPRATQSLMTAANTDGTPSSIASSSSPPSYRFLYRGALSMSGSMLLLDGLTFGARLDSPSKQSSQTFNLLQNPLALALETMRGRPSLRLLGEVKLQEVYLDESGGVEMDIHPTAVLSKIYFENLFCLMPYEGANTSSSTSAVLERSDIGLKVVLGDSNGPETTEIVIFGQVFPSSTSSSTETNTKTIRLCVARLLQQPPSVKPQKRLPRPDDPIPRKPPAFFLRDHFKRTGSLGGLGGGGKEQLKRVASANVLAAAGTSKKQKLMPVDDATEVFKVPELPKQGGSAKTKGKGKEKDVFGDVDEVAGVDIAAEGSRGKQKSAGEGLPMTVDENTLEKANKNVIKRSTIEYLGRIKDPTGKCIDKAHASFKDLYGAIYRGVCFALRAKMRACTLDLRVVDRLVDMHAMMYLSGCGGSAQVLW